MEKRRSNFVTTVLVKDSSSSRVCYNEDICPHLLLLKECMCHRLSNSIARQEGQ
jgi:hypothetical protein